MNWNIVNIENVVPQPWRNGGGVTRELLAWPQADGWVLRLSVADIERDGPFSAFPGVDRWFAVLSGEGVQLEGFAKPVRRGEGPVRFEGEVVRDCALINGPTRDLNLMIRRTHAAGWMQRVGANTIQPTDVAITAQSDQELRGVFSVEGCRLCSAVGDALDVPPMSLAWLSDVTVTTPWPDIAASASSATFAFASRSLTQGVEA
jgi:uncharacterized protein